MKTIKLSIISAGVVVDLLDWLLKNNMLDEVSKGMVHWKNLADMARHELEDELKRSKK